MASFDLVPDAKGRAPDPCPIDRRVRWRSVRPDLAGVVCITGSCSNAGKTTICEDALAALAQAGRPAVALKVTRTHLDSCPRENDGCGVCDDLDRPWRIISDPAALDVVGKDTGRYVAAGAKGVLWLIVDPTHIRRAVEDALNRVPEGVLLMAEGNSFRDCLEADDVLTIMAMTDANRIKPSALHVIDRASVFVGSEKVREAARAILQETGTDGTPWIEADDVGEWVVDRTSHLRC